MRERLPVDSFKDLLLAFNTGARRFAWLPVPLYLHGGWVRDGFAWLRPVTLKRRIAIRSYYYQRHT
jgi:hypothetical protein